MILVVTGFLLLGAKNKLFSQVPKDTIGKVWTVGQAQEWYNKLPWLTGANYIPSNAINQLEMWQADTFDPIQIEKEFKWFRDLGFNTMRVYLHSLVWKQDAKGFKKRIDQFLTLTDKYDIKVAFVFFDDCWNSTVTIGKQPDPKPGVHNSGWLQDPGDPAHQDETLFPFLKEYVQDILRTYAKDSRILFWDLYNEPGGNGPGGQVPPKGETSFPLLKAVFSWAREINPAQPLTSGIWNWNLYEMNAFVAANSDIITYHDYTGEVSHGQYIKSLKVLGKPLICTEYMARSRDSRFENILPLLKNEKVGAINWGFVAGKTNTIYEWGKVVADGGEPDLWFHDILREDGTPYAIQETNLIRDLNNGNKGEVLRLAPGRKNPRNSEGDFVTLKDGRIMFVYSRYSGTSDSDHGTAVLAARYSSDKGKSWTTKDRIVVEQEGKMNVMSVSLLRLKDGKIALFYLRKNSVTDCIPMVRFSGDEGNTWTAPIQIIRDKEGYFVLNNNRVIQLKNGRLIMAVALHHTPDGKWLDKADLYAYYSDDSGKTWQSSSKVPNNTDIITQEPGLIELRDGRLLMFIRASQGKQQLSYSKDKGATWSPIEPSNIQSPLSPASIARIPKTGDLLLVWNNGTKVRSPLTAAISKDEGKTWQYIKNIENDPDGWYCYTAIHFVDDEVLLSYCAGSQSQKTHLNVTDVKKIKLEWFYK